MHGPNGSTTGHEIAIAPVTVVEKPKRARFSQKRVKELLAQLAIPFDPAVIQWKIVETKRLAEKWQGCPLCRRQNASCRRGCGQ